MTTDLFHGQEQGRGVRSFTFRISCFGSHSNSPSLICFAAQYFEFFDQFSRFPTVASTSLLTPFFPLFPLTHPREKTDRPLEKEQNVDGWGWGCYSLPPSSLFALASIFALPQYGILRSCRLAITTLLVLNAFFTKNVVLSKLASFSLLIDSETG